MDLALGRERDLLRDADPRYAEHITLLEGVTDSGISDLVSPHIPAGAQCLVVEDGTVDVPQPCPPGMDPEVVPAIRDWLTTHSGRRFPVRRDLERYGTTRHPHGWLERAHPLTARSSDVPAQARCLCGAPTPSPLIHNPN
ncbi:hypothetical protein AB0903_22850 [Streptomyces sp. NPDC048389]|uniref:hypothetical protein n=1 Tax=Streptomyces sp. NPDC048389 TaxID=3154622 RepID=UPI00345311B1